MSDELAKRLLRTLTELCFVIRTGDKAARKKACKGAEAVIDAACREMNSNPGAMRGANHH